MREILIYGVIDRWGYEASASGLGRVLAEMTPGETVRLRIHSPGGSPFEAAAMRARLEAWEGKVEIIVDGLAASAAASLLATADADVSIADGAFVMIHNTSALADGDHSTLEAALNMLRAVDKATAELFAKRTKKTYKEIVAMMDAETWMTAAEAVAAGFADRVINAPVQASARQRFELSGYRNTPRQLAENSTFVEDSCKGNRMDAKVIARLGLPADATDEQVYAALDALKTPPAAPAAPPAAPAVSQEMIDAAVQRALTAHDAGKQATQAHADAVNAAVERFIAEGKIRPSDRAKAVKACGETAAQLAATVEYWESQPKIVSDPKQLGRAEDGKPALSKLGARMARDSNVKPETIQQIMSEEQENAR